MLGALALWVATGGAGEPAHLVGMSARGSDRYDLVLRHNRGTTTIEASSPQACREAIERLRDDASATVVRTHTVEVVARLGRLRSGAFTLHDTAGRLCAPLEDPHDAVSLQVSIVSAIGPWITVSERVTEAQAGGPPYHGETWQTHDARTGDPASILDVVEESELVAALQRDPWVVARLAHARSELGGATRLAEVFAVLEQHGGVHDLGAFAFVAWDDVRGRVALRLAFAADTYGLGTNLVRQLGLWVRPRKSALGHLRATRRGPALWLGQRPIRID